MPSTRELHELVNHKLVEMHASRRWAFYTLAAGLARAGAVAQPDGDEKKVLKYVREKGSIARRECQTLVGISATQASYLLARMREKGLLRKRGERRWARYELP